MRKATLTNSFSKGTLDPNLSERFDLAHYHQSIALGENCIFFPQGGFGDRGGTEIVSDSDVRALGIPRRMRYRLQPVPVTAAMVTAPNGGTVANLFDFNDATALVTTAVAATPFVVCEVDLGALTTIAAVDVERFVAELTGINETLVVEYFMSGSWHTFAGSADNAARKNLRTTARSRRFAGWPGQSTSARYWRVALYGAAGAGTISLGGIAFWRETAHLSPVRIVTMARSSSEHYLLAISHRNIDVYRNMRWQASIPVPVAASQVREMTVETSLDTMLVFHEQIETARILRQGSDGEWDADPAPFEGVPDLDTSTAFFGSQDEIQAIGLPSLTSGAQVVLMFGRRWTAPITYTSDAAFATDASAALAAIAGGVAADVQVTVTGTRTFRVAFVATLGSRSWSLVEPIVLNGAIAPSSEVTQRGLDASDGSLMWGERTGWPRCGAFVQSRLLVAGFRAAPTSWRLSVVADFFNYLGPVAGIWGGEDITPDRAFGGSIDVDEIEAILHVVVGRHLQFFTERSEWYMETRTLDAKQPVNMVMATRVGVARGVMPVFADGTALFIQAGGETLHEFAWVDTQQSYGSDPISVLAPHLLSGVVEMSARAARSVREGTQLIIVNGDGSAAMLTMLRTQEVIAMAAWSTPSGAFRGVVTDLDHNQFFVVERDGAQYLERRVPSLPLDCATHVSGSGITSVTGLPFATGRQVWAIVDGDAYGPLTVDGGAVTLPVAGDDVSVGLLPPWRGRLQVVRAKPGEERPFRPPMRIYEAELALVSTGDITIATNGGTHRTVELMRYDGGHVNGGPLQTASGGNPQLPMMQRLYTGNRRVQGLTGWTQWPYIELSRSIPAPVHVKSVRLEVAHG